MTVGGSRRDAALRVDGPRRSVLGLAAATLAALLVGCGGASTDAEQQIEAAVKRTQRAFAARDLAAVCASLTKAGRAQVAQLGHDILGDVPPQPCEPDLRAIADGVAKGSGLGAATGREVVRIDVDGDRATATVAFGGGASGAVPLERENGRWKVDALYGGLPARQREDAY